MLRRSLLSLALPAYLVLSIAAAHAQTSTWTIDRNHSQAGFSIKHLGVSTVRGSISGITGSVVWDAKDPAHSSVNASLDTNTLTTSNDARDKHLKSPDFFNVAQFPTLVFKSTSVTAAGPGKLKVHGDLTLAGVTKPVTLDVDGPAPPQKGPQGKLVTGFSATTVIKRSDFNFGSKFSSPMLGDEVTITLDLEASPAA